MRRAAVAFLALLGMTLLADGVADAATLEVGPNKPYATPCAAIAAAQPNDEVDVSPGTYTDSCEINVAGLIVKGVGGQPKIDLSGTNHPADYKGIYVISADDVRIENLELTGAHIDDSEGCNGAALRVTGHGLVVHGCYIHDNEDGILAAPVVDGGTITIEYTELSHNGLGDGCVAAGCGCTHNVYVSKNSATVRYDKTIFQFNWTHDLATDTPDKGHLLKSRSRETDVLYNRITGEMGHDSYEIDISNGGLGIVVGNMIEKGPNPDNDTLLGYGLEGIDNTDMRLFVANNTFVNDFTKGTFINMGSGGVLTAHDNIMVGPGTPASTGALSADNLSGVDPLLVDPKNFDYHLQAGSPARGKAVDPGMAGTFSLTPTFEYVQPLQQVARASDKDLGAYEYGTSAGQDGGGTTDGGGTGDDGGPMTTRDDGGGSGGGDGGNGATSGSNGGCGCGVAGSDSAPRACAGLGLIGLIGLASMARRRRTRRATGRRPSAASR
jgi:MYXO-CTERM domain-containing protein